MATCWSVLLLLLPVLGCQGPAPAPAIPRQAIPQPDKDWNAVFVRTTGWTGADGAASVPLSGDRVLWLFGDTWIGPVVEGRHGEGSAMVNNTVAVSRFRATDRRLPPTPEDIRFYWGKDGERPAAWSIPEQPQEWFWPAGGGALAPGPNGRDRLLLFMTRLGRRDSSDSIWNFAVRGTTLRSIANPEEDPERWRQTQTTLTTLAPGATGETVWGSTILVDSDSRSVSIYIYGVQAAEGGRKTLLLASAPAASVERFETWRFRSGDGWSTRVSDARPVVDDMSSELSVHRLAESGRYVMVYTEPPLGSRILVRTAPAAEGPWSTPRTVYTCPEPAADARIFVYSARAHPELSKPGELLITYCVNATDFWHVAAHAAIYAPRFVRVPLPLIVPDDAG